MQQQGNIFKEVQDKYSIVEVARDLGLKVKQVGKTYRSDSIAPDGGGENALALYESTNTWYDFKLQESGDVTELVARVKYNGDKRAALQELMPNFDNGRYNELLKKKQDFADTMDFYYMMLNTETSEGKRAIQYLLDRRISLDTINKLKIGLERNPGKEIRIIFPYWDESGREIIYYITRRFNNWQKCDKDGVPTGVFFESENSPKYKKASLEEYPFLRNAPLGLNTLKRNGKNGDGTLVITEGMFDWLSFYQEGYSVLATNGGDFGNNWKEVIEKIMKFKKVILAFDNDDAGRNFTYKAAEKLMEEKIPFYCAEIMTKDVSEYYTATGNLNPIINSAKPGFEWILESLKGKDNFEDLSFEAQRKKMEQCRKVLTQMGAKLNSAEMHEALFSIRNYFPREWVSATINEIKKAYTPTAAEKKKADYMRIVNSIADDQKIIYDSRVGFYEYVRKEGRWVSKFDESIGTHIMNALGDEATGGKLTSILKLLKSDFRIQSDAAITKFNTKPLICFKNCTLHINLKTGELVMKPHSFDDWNTVTLPYDYDPNAKCENWLKFIEEVTGNNKEAQDILQEFPGYALMPNCDLQKCLMLKGDGANGKSVYTEIISALFGGESFDGRGYVSFVEPNKFKENFRLMPFMSSFINISSDTETELKGGEGVFKRIVAGEMLEDSYKHKNPVQFRPRSKLILCCNYYPAIGDISEGMMRRYIIVEFPMHYVHDPRPNTNERKLDISLKEKLYEELPGIFNWIIEGLRRLIRNKEFTGTNSKQQKKLIREFVNSNSPMHTYLEEVEDSFFEEETGQGKEIDRTLLFKKFNEWAIENYINPIAANRFYTRMRSVLRNIGLAFTENGRMWKFADKPKEENAA